MLTHDRSCCECAVTTAEICSGSEAGSYSSLIDACRTWLESQGPLRTCNKVLEGQNSRNKQDKGRRVRESRAQKDPGASVLGLDRQGPSLDTQGPSPGYIQGPSLDTQGPSPGSENGRSCPETGRHCPGPEAKTRETNETKGEGCEPHERGGVRERAGSTDRALHSTRRGPHQGTDRGPRSTRRGPHQGRSGGALARRRVGIARREVAGRAVAWRLLSRVRGRRRHHPLCLGGAGSGVRGRVMTSSQLIPSGCA